MKSFLEFISEADLSEISRERATKYMDGVDKEDSQGKNNGSDRKAKNRDAGYSLAADKQTGHAKVSATESVIAEVEGPRSELDKKVFREHPVKVTDYPVANAGERDVKTVKDRSRRADKHEDNEATGGNPPSETPLYAPESNEAKQKIMQYFRSESKEVSEDVKGTYRASFYGQLKRRITKGLIATKPATTQLTSPPDIDDAKQGKKGLKDIILPKAFPVRKESVELGEVSNDRLRQYMDKNDAEYGKDSTFGGDDRKAKNRANGHALASNKRVSRSLKTNTANVPAGDK